jgi:hypothetical protein
MGKRKEGEIRRNGGMIKKRQKVVFSMGKRKWEK